MSDRKQIAFDDSLHFEFMKTDGKTQTDKMIHLLAVDRRKTAIKTAIMTDVDKKIDNLQDSVDEIKKLLEGVIR